MPALKGTRAVSGLTAWVPENRNRAATVCLAGCLTAEEGMGDPALKFPQDLYTALPPLGSSQSPAREAEARAGLPGCRALACNLSAHTIPGPRRSAGGGKPWSLGAAAGFPMRRERLTRACPWAVARELGQGPGERPGVFPSLLLGLQLTMVSDYTPFLLSLLLCVVLATTTLGCSGKSN